MPTEKVESAPAKEELTAERRAELKRKLRERMSKSKLDAKGPEGWTGYWARKEDTAELARLDYLGFRIVRESKDRRWKAQGAREDGTYVMGDVILMEIRTEEYEIMMEEISDRSRNQSTAAKQTFIDSAEGVGAPTFKINR